MPKLLALFLVLAAAAAAAEETRFSVVPREVIEQRLNQVQNSNEARQATLKRLFEESGCNGERLDEQKVKNSKLPNVVCTLAGSGPETIIVGAHFDFAGAGSTGIADNWTGASLLPSLFASLTTHPRKHTFVFVGFTDEEKGLVGSKHYARQLKKDKRTSVRAMVNIDTVGLSTPKIWASRADKQLLQLISDVAASMSIPLQGVNFEKVGSTDSEPFREAKVPAITVHSVTQENWQMLHSPQDTAAIIKAEDYYNTYRLLAGYLAYLDSK